jgi:hypothetical protein
MSKNLEMQTVIFQRMLQVFIFMTATALCMSLGTDLGLLTFAGTAKTAFFLSFFYFVVLVYMFVYCMFDSKKS